MQLSNRIQAFHQLGQYVTQLSSENKEHWCRQAQSENAWFTPQSVALALHGIARFLEEKTLTEWTSRYTFNKPSKTVATILAGNIPLVGFHDFLCVLISGHKALLKVSSKDSQLIRLIIARLLEIEPRFAQFIEIADGPLKNFDAVIATGSDNSARYFDHYFGKYPNMVRKNRTSCAVLTGHETPSEMAALGVDVFTYFGLGCRNVSKLFVPSSYSFQQLLDNWASFSEAGNHHKFHNNYDYQKAILLVNSEPHLDTGFLLLQESEKLVSPISVLYYEYYQSEDDVINKLLAQRNKLQCIVGSQPFCTVPFGNTQQPTVSDYADDVDTLAFLTKL
jgi:hypothetical protein